MPLSPGVPSCYLGLDPGRGYTSLSNNKHKLRKKK